MCVHTDLLIRSVFFPLQVIRFGYFVVRDQAAQLPLGLPLLRQPQVKAKIPTTNYYAQRIFLLQTPGPEQEKQVQSKRIGQVKH